jgi:glycosyltransferase involved in cell wall biosynthesis
MRSKVPYFDVTFLHYCDNPRGIPQVISQLIRLFQANEFKNMRYIATRKVKDTYLTRLGVHKEQIVIVQPFPFLSFDQRFHGIFSAFRYGKILDTASILIHSEYRTVVKTNIPQVVIFYDFIYLESAAIIRKTNILKSIMRKLYRVYLYRKLKNASTVAYKIAISDFTRNKFIEYCPQQKESITTLHLGTRFINTTSKPMLRQFDIINYLCVGGLDEQRKNITALLENYNIITHKRASVLHLVSTIDALGKQQLERIIDSNKLNNVIKVHGVVSDQILSELYAASHFLLFPSLMEGFGLPIIEAMQKGIVVCAFRNSSIPEVGGDAIVLAENNDFKAWGTAIDSLVFDKAKYYEMSKKAVNRAEYFSEERMFQRYRNYFQSIL